MTKTPGRLVPRGRTAQLVPRRLARIPTPRLRYPPAVRGTRARLRALLNPAPPESYLAPAEQCLIRTRLHWLVPLRRLAQAAIPLPLTLLLTIALTYPAPGIWWLQVTLWLAAVTHQGWLAYLVLLWRAEHILVTDKRLIRIHGVLTTTVDSVYLDQITDTAYHRSFPGHVFGYGSFRIESAGQNQSLERMDFVPHPEAVYQATLPT